MQPGKEACSGEGRSKGQTLAIIAVHRKDVSHIRCKLGATTPPGGWLGSGGDEGRGKLR